MSLPLTPFERWLSGTNQNSIPANNNSLRAEIFATDGIADDVNAQPGSPADGDWYIMTATPTGSQWADFEPDSVAIFYGGLWYEFVPAEGNQVTVAGTMVIYEGSGGWVPMSVPSSGVNAVVAGHAITVDATDPSNPEVAVDETELDPELIPFSNSGFTADNVADAIVEASAGGGGGGGDVVGPASATADGVALYDGTTGKLLKDGPTVATIKQIDQNSQSTAYTFVLADAGKHILHPSADTTARIFTVPANSSVAYPVGTAITIVNQNAAGVITIAITTDTMRLAGAGTTGSRTLAANGMATALKITSTEWIISGTGLT